MEIQDGINFLKWLDDKGHLVDSEEEYPKTVENYLKLINQFFTETETKTNLTNHQRIILLELASGGKIFSYQFGDRCLFEDCDGNTYKLRKDTFKILETKGLIEVIERPSVICQIYGLTKKGKTVF
jgi:hypothetical protein